MDLQTSDLAGEVTAKPFICRSCVAACGLVAHLCGPQVVRISGDRDHPVSGGYSCAKGRAIGERHHAPTRLDQPSMRGAAADWSACLDDIAAEVARLTEEGGPDRIAAYSGMGLYVDTLGWWGLERLFAALGSRQRYTTYTIDMSTVLRSCELVIGFPLLPHWTPEDPDTRLVLLIGTNPSVSHGHTVGFANPTQRFRQFRNAGGELWVMDPRTTRTARMADRHLAPRPNTDAHVLAWLVRELLIEGADQQELAACCAPQDVERLRAAVEPFTLSVAAEAADLDPGDLLDLLAAIRRHRRLAVLTGTGLSFSPDGVVADWLRLALLIVTGSLDRKGGMRFNVGGAMRSEALEWRGHAAEDGAAPAGPRSRPELRQVIGQLPSAALVDEIEAGEVRGLIIAGGNPLASLPQPDRVRAALAKLEMLVVIDCFDGELPQLATHVLPAPWQLERPDVLLMGDRSMHTPAVLPPEGYRQPTWWMFAQLAQRLGLQLSDDLPADADEAAAMSAFARYSRDGLAAVEAAGPHGLPAPLVYGWVRERVLPEGRWRLAPPPLVDRLAAIGRPTASARLVSGRRMNSNNSVHYSVHYENGEPASPPIHLSPDVAAEAGAVDGDVVRVRAAAGELHGPVCVDQDLRPGAVWINHGWASRNVNRLINDQEIDPLHGQPAQSGIDVKVERIGFVAR